MTGLDEELAKYRAIPESWTYCIVSSNRDVETVVESGIVGCSKARERAEQLQSEYNREHPELTYWTRDLFHIDLEHK